MRLRPLTLERAHGLDQSARRVDHVVDDHRVLAGDVTDEAHEEGHVGAVATLVDDGEIGVEPLGDRSRALHAPRVRRHDHRILQVFLAEVVDDDRGGEQVIHGDVEESLDLSGVQIEGQEALHSCRFHEIRHELGRDGHSGLNLPVLPGVAIVGQDGSDAARRRTLERIRHDEQLHQRIVDGRAGGLNDEHVRPPHVLRDMHEDLAVREPHHFGGSQRYVKVLGDLLRQRSVRVSRE